MRQQFVRVPARWLRHAVSAPGFLCQINVTTVPGHDCFYPLNQALKLDPVRPLRRSSVTGRYACGQAIATQRADTQGTAMSIDLSEFHDVFFEECFEGLEVMESGLLTLDQGTDIEEINAIFRAAHSIKGGGASFGFAEISEFTHVMETLLDEMRDGRRSVTRPAVDLLLESVDCLRAMVNAARDKADSDQPRIDAVKQRLQEMLATPGGTDTPATDASAEMTGPADTGADQQSGGWKISFKPHTNILQSGNDPVRIFRELALLGELSSTADISGLPDLAELKPENCYLGWLLELRGDISREAVIAVFDWAEGDCELEITPLDELDAVTPSPAGHPCS